MCPNFTKNNIIYGSLMNIKHLCNIYLRKSSNVKVADFQHLNFSKFCAVIRFTFLGSRTVRARIIVSSMFMTICLIVFWSIPSQVGEVIICRLTVIMARLHSGRARADEGGKNQFMHGDVVSFTAISLRMDNKVAQPGNAWIKYLLGLNIQHEFAAISGSQAYSSPIRPNPSLVRNVVPCESFNRQPYLLSLIGDRGNVLVSHGVALLYRVALWLGPLRCSNTVTA